MLLLCADDGDRLAAGSLPHARRRGTG